jgi:predicted nucleotidyltransferase
LTWFLSEKSNYIDKEEPWNISLFAINISNLYKKLPVVRRNLKQTNISVKLLSDDEYLAEDGEYLRPIIRLKEYVHKNLTEYVCDFLIHGSIATMDYSKGWSDLDTLVIVNDETLLDPQKLIAFRMKIIDAYNFLLQMDVHQHHGFIFCSEVGLKQYYSHFMPLEVISKSKSLLSDNDIAISHNRSVKCALNSFKQKNNLLYSAYLNKVLKHHKYKNDYLCENFKNPNTMYQLKYFLSVVMTLPTYYLDAKGEPCYKKDSFEIVKNEFKDEWEIIEKATKIRKIWPSKELHPYVGNLIPNWVIDILGREYFYRAYRLSNAMLNSLTNVKV